MTNSHAGRSDCGRVRAPGAAASVQPLPATRRGLLRQQRHRHLGDRVHGQLIGEGGLADRSLIGPFVHAALAYDMTQCTPNLALLALTLALMAASSPSRAPAGNVRSMT